MAIRVLHVGLGPIGAAVLREVSARRGLRTVGAVDPGPDLVGRDAGEVADAGRRLRVRVRADLAGAIADTRPDVALVCTGSSLAAVMPLFEMLLAHRVAIVSTTEELVYPAGSPARLGARLDGCARRAGVAVLGTGVNPGFAMDAWPIALTAVCTRVDAIRVDRVQDAAVRRVPFQRKIGVGLTVAEFRARVAEGQVRHVGLAESVRMIADALGWRLSRVTDDIAPVMARRRLASAAMRVAPGQVCGLVQDGIGYVGAEPRIHLHMAAHLGAAESYDQVTIAGVPPLRARVEGGIHGDIATAAMVVNAVGPVLAAAPGLRTMRDMPLPSFWPGPRRASR